MLQLTDRQFKALQTGKGGMTMTTGCVVIEIPLPPKHCSPNARFMSHWGARSRSRREYRLICAELGRYAKFGAPGLPFQKAIIHADFYQARSWKTVDRATFRDEDNARSSLKSAVDGLIDCGALIADDSKRLRWGEINLYSKKTEHMGRSCVVLKIEEMKGCE